MVPNGTVLNAFMGSEEFDHADYSAEKGGFSGDCKIIGRFRHTVAPMLNNPINVMIKQGKWKVTGDSYITSLTCGADAIDLNGYTLHVGDETYEEGTASAGEAIEFTVSSGIGGGAPGGNAPDGNGGASDGNASDGKMTPPAKPDGGSSAPGGKGFDGKGGSRDGNGHAGKKEMTPSAKPDGDTGTSDGTGAAGTADSSGETTETETDGTT